MASNANPPRTAVCSERIRAPSSLSGVQLTKGGVHDYATSADRSSSVEATGVRAKPAMPSSLPEMSELGPKIGIGGRLATPPLPHHRAYGSVPRRFDRVRLGRARRFGEDRATRNSRCVGLVG